jgi:hypothetical protein
VTAALTADWVPSIIRWRPAPMVEWCHLGDLRFTDPFFEQAIRRAMHQPFNLLFSHRTPLSEIAATGAKPELRLAGLIFHMSRCGSTVISQMLAALARNVVLSEPAPLDQIVRIPARLGLRSVDDVLPYLRGIVAALGKKRRPQERDLFIKLDAWHVLLLPLFRRAFPGVPWVFVYRDPVEVLASLARSRPLQMFPHWIDAGLLAPAPAGLADLPPDTYATHVLACFLRAAIEHHRDGGLLVKYGELPEAVCTRVRDHFGLDCSEADLASMRAAARQNVKQAGVQFRPDGAAKRRSASAEIRLLAESHLAPLAANLDAMRSQQGR